MGLRKFLDLYAGSYTCLWEKTGNLRPSSVGDGVSSLSTGVSDATASIQRQYRYEVVVCPAEPLIQSLEDFDACVEEGKSKKLHLKAKLKRLVLQHSLLEEDLQPIQWRLEDGLEVVLSICRNTSAAASSSSCETVQVLHPRLINVDECHVRIDVDFLIPEIESSLTSVRIDYVAFCAPNRASKYCGRRSEDQHEGFDGENSFPSSSSSSSPGSSYPPNRRYVFKNHTAFLIRYHMKSKQAECYRVSTSAKVGMYGSPVWILLFALVAAIGFKVFRPFLERSFRDLRMGLKSKEDRG